MNEMHASIARMIALEHASYVIGRLGAGALERRRLIDDLDRPFGPSAPLRVDRRATPCGEERDDKTYSGGESAPSCHLYVSCDRPDSATPEYQDWPGVEPTCPGRASLDEDFAFDLELGVTS